MRHSAWAWLWLCSAVVSACAGGIDDWAEFENYERDSAAATNGDADDAGSAGAEPEARERPVPRANGGVPQFGAAPSSSAAEGGGSAPEPACDLRALTEARCGNANCHGGPTAGSGLDLTSPGLAMRVAGRNASGNCSAQLLVDRAAPAQSALYQRVTGTSCGLQMPVGGELSASERACVLSWIEGL